MSRAAACARLAGAVVTLDALHVQAETARHLVEDEHAHYLMIIKGYPEAGWIVSASSIANRAWRGSPVEILDDVVLDGFVRALDGFEAVLAGVAPDRWDAPSPCEGWCAVDVAGHVIGELRAVEAYATGHDEIDSPADPGPAAGDDPVAAWRAARADMMAALDAAALARPVPLPWGGQMPLGEWLERYPVEFLVHTWDLAQATGQAAGLDRGLVRDALEPAREFIPVFRMSGLVGPECVVAQDADDLTRLLAIFGRRKLQGLKIIKQTSGTRVT
jgi:uncharacterized protein (TIGR03086 family)